MATITAGNELYLYQLLVREVGVGRQVMLSRIEEVLLADDIWPSDLGCESVREVLENLSSFVRLTVFKRGRVYATVVSNPEWDAILERAKSEKDEKPTDKGGAKSWRRKRAKRDPKLAKPRPKGRPKPEPEVLAEPEAEPETLAESECEPEITPAASPEPPVTEEEQTEDASAEPEALAEPISEPTPEPKPEALAKPGSAPEPKPQPEPAPEVLAEPGSVPEPKPQPGPAPSPTSQTRLPESFGVEVLIRNKELSALYQMLPIDVDPIALLDEDWRVARSTNALKKGKGVVSFPLRYLSKPDGSPVRASIRRSSTKGSSKRWVLEDIQDIGDVGLEGLPVEGDDPSRELAQLIVLGPWDELLGKLAQRLADTDWSPSQGQLQEYLALTFHRIRCEDKLVTYDEGSRGVFDTGLLTSDSQSILMCLRSHEGDIPWEFESFSTPEEAGLKEQNVTPLPPSYITVLDNILLSASTNVTIDKGLLRTYGPELQREVDVAVRHAKRDYRLATPAYDPVTNVVRLLVPVTLADDERRAMVLHPEQDGFVVNSILPLERAAECARVISVELPRWM